MEELIRVLAQFGLAGVLIGVIIWFLHYVMTKLVPRITEQQALANIEMQKAHTEALKTITEAFERTTDRIEARGIRDEERCERRHTVMMGVMERCSVKLEEISYDIDLVKSQVLQDPNEEVRFPAAKKKPTKGTEHHP